MGGRLPAFYAPVMAHKERVLTPEQQAKAAHQKCHDRWARLTEEQRSGTTFHPWEAHLQPSKRPS